MELSSKVCRPACRCCRWQCRRWEEPAHRPRFRDLGAPPRIGTRRAAPTHAQCLRSTYAQAWRIKYQNWSLLSRKVFSPSQLPETRRPSAMKSSEMTPWPCPSSSRASDPELLKTRMRPSWELTTSNKQRNQITKVNWINFFWQLKRKGKEWKRKEWKGKYILSHFRRM